jgi:hypothetical protein
MIKMMNDGYLAGISPTVLGDLAGVPGQAFR